MNAWQIAAISALKIFVLAGLTAVVASWADLFPSAGILYVAALAGLKYVLKYLEVKWGGTRPV